MKESLKSRKNCSLTYVKSQVQKPVTTGRVFDPVHILNESDNNFSFVGRNVYSSFQNALKNLKLLSNIKDLDMDHFEWPLENDLRDKLTKFIEVFNFCDQINKMYKQDDGPVTTVKQKKLKNLSVNTQLKIQTLKFEKLLDTAKYIKGLNYDFEDKSSQDTDEKSPKSNMLKSKKLVQNEDTFTTLMFPLINENDSTTSLVSLKQTEETKFFIIKHNENSTIFKNQNNLRFTNILSQLPIYGHTSESLSIKCKNILRDIGKNEKLKNYLINLKIKGKINSAFISEFEKLLKTMKKNFQLNVVENYAKDMYIVFSTNRRQNYLKIIALLLKIKKISIADNANMKNEIETKIRNYKLEAITHKELVAENFKTIERDTHEDEIMEKYNQKLDVLYKVLEAEISKLNKKIESSWASEVKLRLAKKNLNDKIEMLKQKIDDTSKEHIQKKLNLSEETSNTKNMISMLEKNYYPLEKKYAEIMEQRRRYRANLASEKLIEERRLAAALKIQNWFRSYKIRKKCTLGYKSVMP